MNFQTQKLHETRNSQIFSTVSYIFFISFHPVKYFLIQNLSCPDFLKQQQLKSCQTEIIDQTFHSISSYQFICRRELFDNNKLCSSTWIMMTMTIHERWSSFLFTIDRRNIKRVPTMYWRPRRCFRATNQTNFTKNTQMFNAKQTKASSVTRKRSRKSKEILRQIECQTEIES